MENGDAVNRIEWIDISRGIAILCVVLGHIITHTANNHYEIWCNYIIYSFHMPLFFLLSGAVRKKVSLIEYLKHKFWVRLGFYFGFVFVETLWFIVTRNENIGVNDIFKVDLFRAMGDYWFFIALIVSEIVVCLYEAIDNKVFKLMLCIVFFFIIYGLFVFGIKDSFGISAGILAIPFLLSGFYLRRYIKRIKTGHKILFLIIWVIGIINWTVKKGYIFSMYNFDVHEIVRFYLFGFAGGGAVIFFSQFLKSIFRKNNCIFEYLGKNSVWIYGFHYIGLYFVDSVYKLIGDTNWEVKIVFDSLSVIFLIVFSLTFEFICKKVWLLVNKYSLRVV